MPPKTSLADALGVTTNTEFGTSVDPSAYQYGGAPGGAAGREGYLTQLGAQGANYSNAVNNQYSGAQNNALGMMQQQAQGNDFGVAENQLKQGAANAAQEQFSGAASTRGGGGGIAAAQMNAANNAAAGQANANAQAAQLRSQLQNQGVQNYGAYAQGLSAQQNQANQFNAQLQQGYAGQTNDVYAQQLQAQMNQQQLQSQNALQAQQMASQQGQANAQNNAGLIGSAVGAAGGVAGAIGGLFSSDERMKTNILDQTPGGAKPGGGDMFSPLTYTQSGGNAQGEAALAARDAHTANFASLGGGQGNWFNASNAAPWSKEGDAAQSNLAHYFGQDKSMGGRGVGSYGAGTGAAMLSDTRAKKNAIREDAKNEALAEQAAQLRDAIGSHTQGFEWMNDSPTAVSGEDLPPKNAPQAYMDSIEPKTFDYKDPRVNGGKRRLGFMAQDLERSPTGDDLVHDTPAGKVVDVPALASANAAAVADLHDRVKDLEASRVEPAGPVNLSPQLAPEDHGIYSVYDNGTKLVSDVRAKKNAHDEGFAKGLAAATGYAPDPQRTNVQVLRKIASDPDQDEAWRRAVEAQQTPTPTRSRVDLPDPPPPPMPDPQADRMASRLAAYNAQADAGLRAAVRGDPNHDAQMQDLGFEETEPRVDTNTLKEHLNAIASRTPPKRARGGLAEAVGAR